MERNKRLLRALFKEKIGVVKPEDAWILRMDETLDLFQVPSGWKRFLQDHAYARFTCSECGHWWTSYKVILLFHVRWEPHTRQGCVQMRCFQQQCRECFSKHEEPEFTEESASKVLDHLIVTIRNECYGEHIEDADLSEVVTHSVGPHRRELCEACQLGLHKGSQEQCHKYFSKHKEPEFTEESASKVLDHMIVTIRNECYGEHIEDADLSEVVTHSIGPHRRELCEACQLGLHKGSQDWYREGVSTWEPEGTRDWPQDEGHFEDVSESSLIAVMNSSRCSKCCIYITITVSIAFAFIIIMIVVLFSCGLL